MSIQQLCDELNRQMTLKSASETLTAEEKKSLEEVAANLMADCRFWWMSSYAEVR